MICGVKTLIQSFLRPFGLRLARLQDKPQSDYGYAVLFSLLKRFGFRRSTSWMSVQITDLGRGRASSISLKLSTRYWSRKKN